MLDRRPQGGQRRAQGRRTAAMTVAAGEPPEALPDEWQLDMPPRARRGASISRRSALCPAGHLDFPPLGLIVSIGLGYRFEPDWHGKKQAHIACAATGGRHDQTASEEQIAIEQDSRIDRHRAFVRRHHAVARRRRADRATPAQAQQQRRRWCSPSRAISSSAASSIRRSRAPRRSARSTSST